MAHKEVISYDTPEYVFEEPNEKKEKELGRRSNHQNGKIQR